MITPSVGMLFDQAMALQHHHQAVYRTLVQFEGRAQFSQAAVRFAFAENAKDLQRAVENLNAVGRLSCLTMWHACHIMRPEKFVKGKMQPRPDLLPYASCEVLRGGGNH